MQEIIKRLDEIQSRIDSIDKKLELINNSTKNMDNHISFIEIIYNKVKNPLNYFIGQITNDNSQNRAIM